MVENDIEENTERQIKSKRNTNVKDFDPNIKKKEREKEE